MPGKLAGGLQPLPGRGAALARGVGHARDVGRGLPCSGRRLHGAAADLPGRRPLLLDGRGDRRGDLVDPLDHLADALDVADRLARDGLDGRDETVKGMGE